ncbi:hypothetical protein COCNU_03G009900 [Cocos nucifera]|uniref:Response regulatory domain-containing protein n=1 Tax=Cocos nucifera TaxID=13894 RepID=A0A8K0MZE0_COCNU|nr:hypothetical protein COCNU_03G009900 [Cocos nucifera]
MATVQQMPLSSMGMGSVYGGSSSKVNEPMPKDFPMGLRVLVVDDDTTCLKVLERMLLECHYNGELVSVLFFFLWESSVPCCLLVDLVCCESGVYVLFSNSR